jgi:mannose-1-phosphate guanylyltransferase/phosphomannomutase
MKAVIMAGGEGTRLRPLTSNQPKPMLPVANRPMMEHILRLLKRHDIVDVVVTVAYLASVIRKYFGDGSDLGIDLYYATEETPLGTAGSVKNAAARLDERFIVISGDAVTDIDLDPIVSYHEANDSLATVALKRVENPLEFGIVIVEEDGRIARFLEKPGWGQVFSDTINTGIYVFEPEILDFIPDGEADFSQDVFPRLIEKGAPLYGYVAEGYWCDVGNIHSYRQVHKDVLDGLVKLDIAGFELKPGVWVGEGTDIDPSAEIQGPAIIGDFSRIDAGVKVGEYTVLGSNVILRDEVHTERAIVHDNVYVGELSQLRGCIIGKNADLRRAVTVMDGAVLGEDSFVGDRAILQPEVKVYPFKTVESGAIVSSSIIWESKGLRQLFGQEGVVGIPNVDVTPETATRLAMAFGTTLAKGDVVAAARDASRVARTFSRAIMAGLNATGVNVDDLEVTTEPLLRFHVTRARASGGVLVRTKPNDPSSIQILLIDSKGQNLSEGAYRKIERYLSRGEFRRADAGDFGDITFPPRALEFYRAALEAAVPAEEIASARLKVVADLAWGPISIILPRAIGRLGIDLLAMNAYADPDRSGLSEEEHADALLRISDTVTASGSHLGVLFEPSGSHIDVIDDTGRVLTTHEVSLLFLRQVLRTHPGAVVALPVNASSSLVEEVAKENGQIIWTELDVARASEHAIADGADLVIGAGGGAIFTEFLPSFDGMLQFVKLASFVASLDHPLSHEVDTLPQSNVVHVEVHTPSEHKGTVMRAMTERARGLVAIMVDGVRFETAGGWVLVAPDSREPACHVWAEGPDKETSSAIAREYARRIEEMTREA